MAISQSRQVWAIAQYERALQIKENTFSVNHINTADAINNLGLMYHNQSKYDEAIARYERSFEIKDNAFGAFVTIAERNITASMQRRCG